MTLDLAVSYAREMHAVEGGDEAALYRLEQRYGIAPNTINHLRRRKAKTCDVSLFARLHEAYLDTCERQARRLLLKIETERALGNADDADLADRLRAIAAEIEARKAK